MRTILLLIMLLAGCGGGGGTPSFDFRSASDTTGNYIVAGTLQRYSPTPTEMIAQTTGFEVVSHSVNGQQLLEMVRGGPVQYGVDVMTVEPLRDQLLTDGSRYTVIGAGMVDALFTDMPVVSYLALVREAVATVRAAGKTPILRGFHRLEVNALVTAPMQARLVAFDAALQAEAAALGVPYLDLKAAAPEMAADLLHPTLDYHRRIAAAISAQLIAIVNGTQ